MSDAAILAWVIRIHSTWIDRSPLTYREVVEYARIALRRARGRGLSDSQVRRSVAISVIDLLTLAGPSTM